MDSKGVYCNNQRRQTEYPGDVITLFNPLVKLKYNILIEILKDIQDVLQ